MEWLSTFDEVSGICQAIQGSWRRKKADRKESIRWYLGRISMWRFLDCLVIKKLFKSQIYRIPMMRTSMKFPKRWNILRFFCRTLLQAGLSVAKLVEQREEKKITKVGGLTRVHMFNFGDSVLIKSLFHTVEKTKNKGGHISTVSYAETKVLLNVDMYWQEMEDVCKAQQEYFIHQLTLRFK